MSVCRCLRICFFVFSAFKRQSKCSAIRTRFSLPFSRFLVPRMTMCLCSTKSNTSAPPTHVKPLSTRCQPSSLPIVAISCVYSIGNFRTEAYNFVNACTCSLIKLTCTLNVYKTEFALYTKKLQNNQDVND